MMPRIFFVLIVLTLPNFANAAIVSIGETPWGEPTIHIAGKIEKGDLEKIKLVATDLLKNDNEIQFSLDSPGGSLLEAINIGEFVKKLNARTMVVGISTKEPTAKITKCYSACFVILVSGSIRDYNGDNVFWDKEGNRRLKEIPVVGIHRPSTNREDFSKLSSNKAREFYKHVENLTRSYLRTVSISQEIIDAMFRVSSQNIKLIGNDEYSEKIGYKQPFFEEWIYSKCGGLDPKEITDLGKVLAERIITGNKSAIPNNISSGYVGYLEGKSKESADCKSKTVLTHQKKFMGL